MRYRTQRQRGFTLIELVVSLSITAVLMTGLGSALVIASRAMPDPQSNAWAAAPDAILAVDTIAADLMVAQTVSEKTGGAVTFTVADRDNDALPDTIRYAWAGTKGDPVTRQLNNGTVTNLLDGVEYFNLAYSLATTTQTSTSPTTTEPEGVVDNFDGWGATPSLTDASTNQWAYYIFSMVPPTGATSLNITRVKLKMARQTTDPTALVIASIHPWESVAPGAAIGSSASLLASTLPSPSAWVEFTFSDVEVIAPAVGDSYVVLLKGSINFAGYAEYQYLKNAPPDSTRFGWTTNSGGNWSPSSEQEDDYDAQIYVYGSYTTNKSSQVTLTRYFVKGVEVSLNTQFADENEFVAGTPVLNMPEVSGP